MTKRDQDYAVKLNKLDELHAAGGIAPAEYEVRRARLLAEAAKPPMSAGAGALMAIGCILGGLLLLYVLLMVVAPIFG